MRPKTKRRLLIATAILIPTVYSLTRVAQRMVHADEADGERIVHVERHVSSDRSDSYDSSRSQDLGERLFEESFAVGAGGSHTVVGRSDHSTASRRLLTAGLPPG